MNCQLVPPSSDFVVYQFPESRNSPLRVLQTLGSPTDEVWPPMFASVRPMFLKSVIAIEALPLVLVLGFGRVDAARVLVEVIPGLGLAVQVRPAWPSPGSDPSLALVEPVLRLWLARLPPLTGGVRIERVRFGGSLAGLDVVVFSLFFRHRSSPRRLRTRSGKACLFPLPLPCHPDDRLGDVPALDGQDDHDEQDEWMLFEQHWRRLPADSS